MPGLSDGDLAAAMSAAEREQREERAQHRLLRAARAQVAELEQKVDLLTALDGISVQRAEWAQPGSPRTRQAGIANLLLSDLHLDEVVDPEEMRGKNAYNRVIALQRLHRVGANTVKMAKDYISGVSYDGLFVWVNGDVVSGNIHEELRRTNDAKDVIDSVDYWSDHLATLLVQLAECFGKVHVVTTPGNHGRNDKKPPAKGAVQSSFDWLAMRVVWRELRSDERFTWNIPNALDVREQQYGTRYLMQHGDDFQGGDQIAGAVRPVMMGDYRTLTMEVVDGEPYDMMLVGHFHQYTTLPRAIINGSLKGYDEWAKRKKFRPEPPKQAFWITTPEHGPSFHLPILPMDRDAEGW